MNVSNPKANPPLRSIALGLSAHERAQTNLLFVREEAPEDAFRAVKKTADKNTSAKRAGSKAKSSVQQAQTASQQAQAVPQQTQAAAQPATPTLAAQAPADAQGAPSTQAVNAPQDSAVKRTEDPKGSSQGAGADSGLRARETTAAELAQRRARKQKELRRKHNKEARKQRKSANRRK